MTGTLSTPQIGSPNSSEDPKVATAITTLNGELTSSNLLDGAQIGAGTVSNAALSSSLALPDSKLASPNNSAYKTLLDASSVWSNAVSASTRLLGGQGWVAGTGSHYPLASGNAYAYVQADQLQVAPPLIYFDDADYTVAGLTQKLGLRAQVLCNATSPGTITYTFGLYPVTVAGAANALSLTLGTVVSSSTVAIANPSASTVNQSSNAGFSIPAVGLYALGVVSSASQAANAVTVTAAQLRTRNV